MDDWKLPWIGGCRCDRLRFEITAPPMITMACHCTGCQKMSASAFSLSIAIPTDGFRVIKGEAVIGGMHAENLNHMHCDWCKSWVYTQVDPSLGFYNVRPSMLDDFGWFEPFIESYTSEALPWAQASAKHSFTEFPALGDYASLIAEFANTGPRPHG